MMLGENYGWRLKQVLKKTALISKLIGKRRVGDKLERIKYQFEGKFICRDCLAINLGISENTLSTFTKLQVSEDGRGKIQTDQIKYLKSWKISLNNYK